MTLGAGYDDHDAVGLAALVAAREVTPAELLEEAVRRLDEADRKLNGSVHRMADDAAAAIESGLPDGPLRGVPFLIKDLNVQVKGHPTSNGSRFWAGAVADHDSTLVARYRAAGLTLVAKTNTPELGLNMSTEPAAFGPTRNPWDTGRSAGGSSGGSAALVAAGVVPAAQASDGGGSIRIPASACGLFGLKPTRGRVTFAPDAGESWSGMSTVHVVSRSVRDTAVLLDVSCPPAPGDPYAAPAPARAYAEEVGAEVGRLRVAFSTAAPNGADVHPECVAAVEQAARWLEELGHEVSEAAPSYDAGAMGGATAIIIGTGAKVAVDARAAAVGRPPTDDDLEPVTRVLVDMAAGRSAAEYVGATRTMHAESRRIAAFFEPDGYDVFVTPTMAQPPPELGVMRTDDIAAYASAVGAIGPLTSVWNATGQPAMSVPLHWTPDGLPVGVQVVGRFGDEATLLRLAAQLEQAHPWSHRRPPL